MILTHVKNSLSVSGTSFDAELLIHINAQTISLSQLGVAEFDDLVVGGDTDWPAMPYSQSVVSAIKTYVSTGTRLIFDPSASSTVKDAYTTSLNTIETRIMVGIAEYYRSLL